MGVEFNAIGHGNAHMTHYAHWKHAVTWIIGL
jgi:hypothetical protein